MADDTILAHPKTDDEILNKVNEFRRVGIDGSVNQYDRMRKAEDFTIGGDRQWDPFVMQQAKDNGKFALTIPIVKPQIKQIAGSEIQNPQDFIVANTTEGSATIALVLTSLLKQVLDSEHARYEKSQMFESGIGSGQGVLGVFVDKTTDPRHADLKVLKLNEHHCMFDPTATSYDQNREGTGGQFMIWDEPVPREQLEALYPDKKDELVASNHISTRSVVMGNIHAIIGWMTGISRNDRDTVSSFGSVAREGHDITNRTRYLKTHTWWKEYKKCIQWYDSRESELESKFLCKSDEIKAAKEASKANPEIFSFEEVDSFIMHHTITSRDVFLEDRVDELSGVQMFPLVPFWPHWVNGYKSGISEDLIGTQEEINWTHSMALNIVKQTSYPPVIIGSDLDGTKADQLRDQLGKGRRAIINESEYGDKVDFSKPPTVPAFEVFTQQAMNNIKTITGRLDIPESNQRSLSGKAKIVDVQKTQQGSMTVFSNYNHSLAILGNLVVDILRKNDIFSEDEIFATVDVDDLIDPEILDQAKGIVLRQLERQGVQIPQPPPAMNPVRFRDSIPEVQAQMLDKFQDDAALYEQFVNQVEQAAIPIAQDILIQLIHQMKIGKYNTKITVSPMAETMRLIKAEQTFELQRILLESGDVGLDADDLIEATDAPNKDKLRAGREALLARVGASDANVSISRSA